jgi:hypothetical protein
VRDDRYKGGQFKGARFKEEGLILSKSGEGEPQDRAFRYKAALASNVCVPPTKHMHVS